MTDFHEFPKIARYSREAICTEKLDGTCSLIYIGPSGDFLTGSRKRWITPDDDNFGFAAWAQEHKDELLTLGPGRHFGEWWGHGIQRGYGLPKGDRRLSLFNVIRWCEHDQKPQQIPTGGESVKMQSVLPACVGLVPVLWRGSMDYLDVPSMMAELAVEGSVAAPGFMNPEGIVIYHVAGNVAFKKTLEHDDEPKSMRR